MTLDTECKYFERRPQEILLLGGGGLGDSPSELNAGSPALELNFFLLNKQEKERVCEHIMFMRKKGLPIFFANE